MWEVPYRRNWIKWMILRSRKVDWSEWEERSLHLVKAVTPPMEVFKNRFKEILRERWRTWRQPEWSTCSRRLKWRDGNEWSCERGQCLEKRMSWSVIQNYFKAKRGLLQLPNRPTQASPMCVACVLVILHVSLTHSAIKKDFFFLWIMSSYRHGTGLI